MNSKDESDETERVVNNISEPESPSFPSIEPKILKTKLIALPPCRDTNTEIMWAGGKKEDHLDLTLQSIPEVTFANLKTNPIKENEGHSFTKSPEKKDKSPLEATFTSPKESLEDPDAISKSSPRKKHHHNSSDKNISTRKKKAADYTALEFASSSSQTNSLTLSINGEDDKDHLTKEHVSDDERVLTALLALFFALFTPLWSLGMAYWHFIDGNYTICLISLIFIGISVLAVHMAYFSAASSPKNKIWKTCKFISIFSAIPGLPPTILSFCNCIFAMREAHSKNYQRPWHNTRFIFLVESLALAFPQCVLHLIYIAEDVHSLPSLKGYVTIAGMAILSCAVTFARFRHDTQHRPERFGGAIERPIRFLYIWANKGLWFVSYTLVIISLRIALPSHQTVTTIVGIILLIVCYEVPMLLSISPTINRITDGSISGMVSLIPQAISLSSLIFWVNMDPFVYNTENGCFVLGLFFYSEAIILTGWLYDRCMGVEIDLIPIYPHFFVDLFSLEE